MSYSLGISEDAHMLKSLSLASSEIEVRGTTPEGSPYQGTVSIEGDGDAIRLHWSLESGHETTTFSGIGIECHGRLCVARSRSVEPAIPETYPGVVNYDIESLGRLPATWYHPDLAGELGSGVSTGGPTDRICGVYRADYGAGGSEFPSLTKEITEHRGRLRAKWFHGEVLEYAGVGFVWEQNLVVAWSQPPRQDLDVLLYEETDRGLAGAKWFDWSSASTSAGSETLIAR
ncbi:hypothetical protein ACFQ05_35775 [Amycolatopsis umgeniensis]|uniref:Uncharacterized protein n=1 Tax=Amycolatopsis umgeniensis TaxID=336628 RepID=A0A841BAT0_9PSEU|nr:hypothetical protein [Amycolatopsis umgeniensis]MBB5855682.1 hypothetical protein [Amycolatopsis umgeniensis]